MTTHDEASRGDEADDHLDDVQAFVVALGAALSSIGEPAYAVQNRLSRVAAAYRATGARISAFPTFMMVSMGRGEPATVELTVPLSATPRLDQIAALDDLVGRAEHGAVALDRGLDELDEIRDMPPRFGPVTSVVGYAVFTVGLCLILQPGRRDAAAAAVLGAIVGLLRHLGRRQSQLQMLMPVIAAVTVSALSALAIKHDLTDPGLAAMVAALVVFLPGVAMTTAVLELSAGQSISGSSRLVAAVVQLALMAFGIVAGIQLVGVTPASVFVGPTNALGDWAPWVGVAVFAVGVMLANSAPPRSLPSLLVVLYAAWGGQVLGNALVGGYVSAFVGALVMTPVAAWISKLPSAMPPNATFLPGFWLLVPGALGLIGLTQVAGHSNVAGREDLLATAVSIFAVAVGVLCGTLLVTGTSATGRVVDKASAPILERHPGLRRWRDRARLTRHEASPSETDDQPPTD